MDEYMLDIKIEKLPEGGYLATSNSIQGLVAQGRTIAETMEIARDVARKIIESCIEHGDPMPFKKEAKHKGAFNLKIPVGLGV
jgi:predicted RNase H-like HicB family nuclease